MFRKLFEIWKSDKTLLDQTIAQYQEMLVLGNDMLKKVTSVFFSDDHLAKVKLDIYAMDNKINALECKIRQHLVAQLSSGKMESVAASLILMSISKDAERLGDYAKNIYEVFEYTHSIEKDEFYSILHAVNTTTLQLFDDLVAAYPAEDGEKAKKIVNLSYKAQKNCDDAVRRLVQHEGGKDAVACAVMLRFYKRILAHISNVATSIFMPVTKLDYFDEDARHFAS